MKVDQRQNFDGLGDHLTSCIKPLDVCGKVAALKFLLSWIQNLQKDILCGLLETDHDFLQVNQMSEGPLGFLLLQSNKAGPGQKPTQVHTGPREPQVGSTTQDGERSLTSVSSTVPTPNQERSQGESLEEASHNTRNSSKRKVGEVDSNGVNDAPCHDESLQRRATKRRRLGTDEAELSACRNDSHNGRASSNVSDASIKDTECSQASRTDTADTALQESEDSPKGGRKIKRSQSITDLSIIHDEELNVKVFKCNKCAKVIKNISDARQHLKQHLVPDGKYLACNSCDFRCAWRHSMVLHVKRHNAGSYTDLTAEIQKYASRRGGSNKSKSVSGFNGMENSTHQSGNAGCTHSTVGEKNEGEVTRMSQDVKKPCKKGKSQLDGFTCMSSKGSGTYKCNTCEKLFKGVFGATEHKKQHLVPEGKYLKCDSCEHKSRWRHDMRNHVLQHDARSFTDITVQSGLMPPPKKKTSCPPLVVKQAKKVLKKRLIASKVKKKVDVTDTRTRYQYQCRTCGKMYCNSTNVRDHEKQHSVPCGQYILCKHCPSLYRSESSVRGHFARMHEGISWKEHFDLTKMKRQDSQETDKPYVYHCPMVECTQEFSLLSAVQDHIFHHVWGVEDFVKCGHCEKSFKFRHLARKHIARVHASQSCDNLVFVDKAGKQLHAESDGFEKEVLVTKSGNAEEATSNITWYPCPLPCCSAMFRNPHFLKEHGKQHKAKDGKYISCAHCDARFRWRDCIVRHLRKSHNISPYHPDRDWTEIEDPSVLTGSQNWASSNVGRGKLTKAEQPSPKSAKKTPKLPPKSSVLKEHLKRQKAKKTLPTISVSKGHISCFHCLQTFRQRALLFKHIRVYHGTKSPKKNVDYITAEASADSSNAESSHMDSTSASTSQQEEDVCAEEYELNQTIISDTSTSVACAYNIYIDNAENPDVNEDQAENLGGNDDNAENSSTNNDNAGNPTMNIVKKLAEPGTTTELSELHPQQSSMSECNPLHTAAFPTLQIKTEKSLIETEIAEGTNSRTHCFYLNREDVKCNVCAEAFRWTSQLNAHIERCHPNEPHIKVRQTATI